MPTRLVLVRHGQTAANAGGRTQGRADNPLTEVGRAQAAALARALRGFGIGAVYSSPSSRAVGTAEAIAAASRLTVALDKRLYEVDHGDLDGMTGAEMNAGYERFMRRWREEDPDDLVIPGGESLGQTRLRIVAAMEAIIAAHEGGSVAVVSHNLALRTFYCHALGLPLAAYRRLRHDVAHLAIVEARGGPGALEYHVRTLNERPDWPPQLEAPR